MFLASACNARRPITVEDRFQSIRSQFLHGEDLEKSKKDADAAFHDYANRSPEWAWKFRILEADILANQGASPAVLRLLNAQLPASLEDSDLKVRKRMLEALAFSHLGEFSKADEALQEAERRCSASRCGVAGEVARIGGSIEMDRNDQPKAQLYYRRSLEIAQLQGDKFLEVSNLLNLGWVAMLQERYDESIDWFAKAQRLSESIDSRLDEEKALGNLGWDYYKMGDLDKSLDFSSRAVVEASKLGVGIDELEWLNNVDIVHLQKRQFNPAEQGYRRTLELARESQNRRQQIDALSALAYIYLEKGLLDQANLFADQACGLARKNNDRVAELYPLLIHGRILAAQQQNTAAADVFSQVEKNALDASLRWQAEQALAQIDEQQRHFVKAEAEYRSALATLRAARSSIQSEDLRMPFLANATDVYDSYIHFLIVRGEDTAALTTANTSRAMTLAEGLRAGGRGRLASMRDLNPQRLALESNSVVLFYWLGSKDAYLWVVTRQQTKLFTLLPTAEIESLVVNYRRAALGPWNVLDTVNPAGMALYQALVEPAAELIPNQSRVIVVADGMLSGFNFETLLVPKPKAHYWIEDVTIVNASSLKLMDFESLRRGDSKKKLLLMGDSLAAESNYVDLPGAGTEMTKIESHFPRENQTVYERQAATAPNYLISHPEQFSYIHFVAHGTANLMSPLDSAVVLSRSTVDGNYKLYARDIIQRPLHAELVTVSTCYGAGTRAYAGEGLVGLSWAFLRAGAHNVIGALWEVSDASTPQLMDKLYEELSAGRPPDEALRTAKLSLLHSDSVFRKPYYWAAFQLYTGS